MLTHTATVRGRAITWDHREVVQHGLNADRVELVTDREWQECDRVVAVLAKAGKESVRVDAGDGFFIPSALMEDAGPLRMCLLGYKGDSVRIVTAKEDAPLCVVESGEVAGMDPAPEQPDLWAQLMEEVRKATDGAKTAAQSATRAEADLRAAAERGDFDGEDGKTPVRGVDYWTEADRKPIEDATLAATTAAGRADAAAATATEGEASRVADEAERVANEAERVEAESGRKSAEATRAANESKRTETFNTNLVSWNSKVDAACKKATDTASKAAQDAKTATDAAIAKTEEATQAAVAKAQTATDNATTAANKAEAAVSKLPLPLGNTLKGEAESTFINLHDSWKAPILKGKVLGQSNQLTTKGINLLLNCEAKETKDFPWGLHPTTPLTFQTPLPTGQYTVSVECAKSVNFYYKEPGNTGTSSSSYSTVSITAKDGNRMKATFTADKPIGALYFYYASEGKYSIAKAQIEAGAKATAYEPYTGGKPSPSPEYPQEITNLNKAEIITTNKNLIPLSAYVKTESWDSAGLTIKNNHDGTFSYSGKMTDNGTINAWLAGGYGIKDVLFVIPPGSYVCSGCKLFYDKEDAALAHGSKNDTDSAGIFTVTRPMRVTGIRNKLLDKTDAPISGTWKPMLEVSLEKTEFMASNYTTTPIDLKDNELCSLPNGVKDEVVIDAEGNVSLIKRVAKVNLETLIAKRIQRQSNGKWLTYIAVPQIKSDYTAGCAICNKLVHVSNLESAAIHGNIFVGSNNLISLGIPENLYPNVDVEEIEATPQIKAWFDDIKVGTVVYGMATTPQIIPLGKVELPALPEATSNVWNDGNIPANVYINYLKDVNIAFADLESKLTQAVVAAAANL